MMKPISKLDNTGNSIFSVMSALAGKHQALNLSQGFPDFPVDPELIELVNKAMKDDHNQYPPMPGVQGLRDIIVHQANARYGCALNADSDITITAGATQAIFTAIVATVHPADEVIIFTPAYDCYRPAIELCGAKTITVPLVAPDFSPDWQKLQDAISPKTRMIIVNTPHNPSGTLFTRDHWNQLAEMIRETDILILSDEVYEHIVFDGNRHCSVLAVEDLRDRCFVVASFGKTFHVTGWKMGYCLASPNLMQEFKKCHQYIVFTSHSPTQHALAEYMENTERMDQLGAFYQHKRDVFLKSITGSKFTFSPAGGTYFQLLNYREISDEHDVDFAQRLTKENGISSIPISVFNEDGRNEYYLRFCFAKNDETLTKAGDILKQIS